MPEARYGNLSERTDGSATLAACGLIPVVTLGGVIPAVLGAGGAAACFSIARDSSRGVRARAVRCAGVTLACWLLLVVTVKIIAALRVP